MLKTYAVVVTPQNHPPALIGPFIAESNAKRYAGRIAAFESRRTTSEVEAFVAVAHPGREYLDPRVPTDPWTLGRLIDQEEDQDVFPSLYARLHAQLGGDVAEDVWSRATGWGGNETSGREQLLASAEDWRTQRLGAALALKRIAVELWNDGMENVQDIRRATGLSRTTVYEALRGAGIDPAARDAEQ
ncbi:hypothetical protein [Streptomyces fuscichromogenes]|uniref:Uncharacterized protein n=1 Tax=Streptomyces fuscichromogenes TaxID=1324013 RepID=A0A917XML1_9ACTN|nr:hypothetical protein [Streptomyces fuscichromogenes]GGN40941.1 hypothetical protein GCM10011578_088710 [Streptomyces fuscichromogenes]